MYDIYKKVNEKRELDKKIKGALLGQTYTKEEVTNSDYKSPQITFKISAENHARIDEINNHEYQILISKSHAEEQERRNYYRKVLEINKNSKLSMDPELRKQIDEKHRKLERLLEYQKTGKLNLSIDDIMNLRTKGKC